MGYKWDTNNNYNGIHIYIYIAYNHQYDLWSKWCFNQPTRGYIVPRLLCFYHPQEMAKLRTDPSLAGIRPNPKNKIWKSHQKTWRWLIWSCCWHKNHVSELKYEKNILKKTSSVIKHGLLENNTSIFVGTCLVRTLQGPSTSWYKDEGTWRSITHKGKWLTSEVNKPFIGGYINLIVG